MAINPFNQRNPRLMNYSHAFGIFTVVEESLQINLFLQNKANFRKSQMNVTNLITADYVKRTLSQRGKNKANSKPIQTQFKPNTNPKQSQYKPNQSQFQKGYLLVKRMIDNYLSTALFPLTSCPAGHYNRFFNKISFLEKIPIERVWK